VKDQNQNASQRLTNRLDLPSWEFVLLIVLLVTVLGVALRAPMNSFPDLAASTAASPVDRDPYDLRGDRTLSDNRNRVETGL
jgi:hypothetical protein